METATETERKYDVPESFELPDLTGVAGITRSDGAETHDLDATYFDTHDLRLTKNRRTLRRRSGGHDAGWHLKTPADGSGRKEHRMPGASEQVPDELRALVRTYVRRHPLEPVCRLRTHRVETPLRDDSGRTLALIAQDQVRADAGDDHSAWQEVEVELVDGDEKLLAAVEKVLLKAGATPAAGPSKLSRALAGRLAASQPDRHDKINPVSRYVREQRDAIIEHDPAARRGDEEAVHKMRVATRRLRSTLKSFRRWFPEPATDGLGDELRWLAGTLGAVRDPQVLEGKLLAGLGDAGPEFQSAGNRIRAALEHRVAKGREELVAALDSDRYLELLDRIDALADTPLPDTRNPAERARKVLAKADERLDTALADGVDEELHAARKKYKQARYAVELITPESGKPAKRLVKSLTALQDGLGAHQDSTIARETLHEIGPDSFYFGVLYGRQEAVGKETLIAVPALVRASRRKKVRRWLVKA
ncbi:CHAD domain-containing protein [Actinoplanes octamycinicus]|uniref:CHAD domain-containing protein n=1 Tax=Actinoplanes octamycinicus TaxID=135948 RepID=A0A7W7M6S5_9ACTN|nr:CYTH and CHAD domain-containing protein [Actinoplanes octamycinicus]MBB4739006.1 CHAD domain-containing protein [Actinoplanes octamycinicus]GIE60136.1 CHAD domain-containing protein [Actinoplanes octamycinicus]